MCSLASFSLAFHYIGSILRNIVFPSQPPFPRSNPHVKFCQKKQKQNGAELILAFLIKSLWPHGQANTLLARHSYQLYTWQALLTRVYWQKATFQYCWLEENYVIWGTPVPEIGLKLPVYILQPAKFAALSNCIQPKTFFIVRRWYIDRRRPFSINVKLA